MAGHQPHPFTSEGEPPHPLHTKTLTPYLMELVPGLTRSMANRVARETFATAPGDYIERAEAEARRRLARKRGGGR